jgi:hypothetical protein
MTKVQDANVMSTVLGNLSVNVEMAVMILGRTGQFVGWLVLRRRLLKGESPSHTA